MGEENASQLQDMLNENTLSKHYQFCFNLSQIRWKKKRKFIVSKFNKHIKPNEVHTLQVGNMYKHEKVC